MSVCTFLNWVGKIFLKKLFRANILPLRLGFPQRLSYLWYIHQSIFFSLSVKKNELIYEIIFKVFTGMGTARIVITNQYCHVMSLYMTSLLCNINCCPKCHSRTMRTTSEAVYFSSTLGLCKSIIKVICTKAVNEIRTCSGFEQHFSTLTVIWSFY